MAHAIWKGNISFGLVNIPVKLYSAEKPNESLNIHLLDKKTHTRIHNIRVNDLGDEVAWDNIDHAYEISKGKYVVVDPKLLAKNAENNFENIAIDKFVPQQQIDPIFFSKPYFLLPTTSATKGYILLRDTLIKLKKVAISSVIIRTKQYIAAVIPHQGILVLILLRYAAQLHSVNDYSTKDALKVKSKPTHKEIELAEQLIHSMSGDWKPDEYIDQNKKLLRKLIKAQKEKGKIISKTKPVTKKETKILDFATLLKQSVKTKQKKK